jgi:phosphoserine phosphatase
MTKIIITRHGETEWNVSGYCQGTYDSPLTANGQDQAKKLADRLLGEKIVAIYSSPLGRAKATAQVIADRFNLPVTPCQEFQEISFGEWEGKAWEELRNIYPEGFVEWEQAPHTYRFPGGENMEEVLVRAKAKLAELVIKHKGETICIVSHGITVKVLVTSMLDYTLADWLETPWQHNTAVNIFEVKDGKYNGLLIGDHSHIV